MTARAIWKSPTRLWGRMKTLHKDTPWLLVLGVLQDKRQHQGGDFQSHQLDVQRLFGSCNGSGVCGVPEDGAHRSSGLSLALDSAVYSSLFARCLGD